MTGKQRFELGEPFLTSRILVLDAMGVIYVAGDDVGDLLVPFVCANGGKTSVEAIETAYMAASLGQTTAAQFWQKVGVDPDLEDSYLASHEITDGLISFLRSASREYSSICCLSNDVSEWSRKLRVIYCLDSLIEKWYISGDMGLRKPDVRIYEAMVRDLDVLPEQITFVDDRQKNIEAAATLGIDAVLYDVAAAGAAARRISNLNGLLSHAQTGVIPS